MSCRESRPRRSAVVLAAAIGCFAAPLPAQGAYASPGPSVAMVAADQSATAPTDQTPIAPFAVVHPSYVPSRSAVDDRLALESGRKPRPVRRTPARTEAVAARPAEPAPVAAPPADVPAVDAPPANQAPPVIATPAPTLPRQVAPAAIDQTRAALSPAG